MIRQEWQNMPLFQHLQTAQERAKVLWVDESTSQIEPPPAHVAEPPRMVLVQMPAEDAMVIRLALPLMRKLIADHAA